MDDDDDDDNNICIVCMTPGIRLDAATLFLSGIAYGMLFSDAHINGSLCASHKQELEMRNMLSIHAIPINALRAKIPH